MAGRRWRWEHLVLVWLLAAGAAVASTLVRFPPGRPLRPLRVRPSYVWQRGELRPVIVLLSRERVLAAGWVAAPLAALVATGVWALGRADESRRGNIER